MTEIHLSDDDRAFIEEQVEVGNFKGVDDAMAAGIRLLREKHENLRRLIQEGLDDVAAGRVMEFDGADDLTSHIIKMAEERKNAGASAGHVAKGAERSSRHL